jgi:hypothetical protein
MLKRSIFITAFTIALFTFSLPIMADDSATDQAADIHETAEAKTPGDILWHCDVQSLTDDNQIVGVETFRDTIYITGAGGTTHPTPNKVHVWIIPGGVCTYLYSVDQPTPEVWGWRDIACDGQYLYASDDRVLDAFTVAPAGVTTYPLSTITLAVGQMPEISVIRAVAYDEDNDWFWTANFSSPIYAFDRTGNMVAGPYANALALYGMAYDNVTPGGPYLWCHAQDSCNVYQFDPNTGTYTGVVYSGWGDDDPGFTGIAGGLCVMEGDPSKDKGNVTLIGITQMVTPAIDEMYFMEIYVEPQESLYWKPPYPDYAPNGMPDIDQKQDSWFKQTTGEYSFCGPVAVANCFKWFDSKYNVPPGTPCDGADQFPLVRDYMDNLPPYWSWDDHDPRNVDHLGTPWLFGATPPPPPTAQPFVPGPQPQPSTMPPWGELVERLAWYFDTDGVRYGYCTHSGTNVYDMQDGIQEWFESEQFEDGSTLADTFCEKTWQKPTFALVESLVEKCEDVILLLGFWFEDPPGSGAWFRCGGHYVTVAGINSEQFLIGISDPYYDNAEIGGRGRVGDGVYYVPHVHGAHDDTIHNDEGNVSHDIYDVTTQAVSPGGLWELMGYPVSLNPYDCERFHEQNVPPEFEPLSMWWNGYSPIFTEVEYAVQISPWDYVGDANGDGNATLADAVFIVNWLFIGGPAPDPIQGDANCDGTVTLADAVFIVNWLFINGPIPKCCDP